MPSSRAAQEAGALPRTPATPISAGPPIRRKPRLLIRLSAIAHLQAAPTVAAAPGRVKRGRRPSVQRPAEGLVVPPFFSYSWIAFFRSVYSEQGRKHRESSVARCCLALARSLRARYASPMYSCAPRCLGSVSYTHLTLPTS